MPNIKFGNIDFSGDGAYIWGSGQYSAPSRSVDIVDVPGRSGDIIIDNGKYNNTKAVFQVIVTGDVKKNTDRLKYLLYSQKGYQRLYDSDIKGFYRMAAFVNGFEVSNNDGCVVFLEFECDPLKYDILGDVPIVIENGGGVVQNPYFENSKPLLKVFASYSGTGTSTAENTLYVNDKDIYIGKPFSGAYFLDARTQYAYSEDGSALISRNDVVKDVDFELLPGKNTITFGEGISKIEVIPRWVTI